MPRNTPQPLMMKAWHSYASMRPRRDAAEYKQNRRFSSPVIHASMRPRRDAAEYALAAKAKAKTKVLQ